MILDVLLPLKLPGYKLRQAISTAWYDDLLLLAVVPLSCKLRRTCFYPEDILDRDAGDRCFQSLPANLSATALP